MNGFFRSTARAMAAALTMFALSSSMTTRATAGSTYYLALGDSVTFGFDPSTASSQVPSYADQGFVKPLADFLGAASGSRPSVLNLAISGELSTSFFDGVSPPGWTYRMPELNLNYPGAGTTQNAAMLAAITGIHAAGDSVGYVSLLLGGNDLQYLAANPVFQAADFSQKQAMVMALLGTIQSNYLTALFELKTLAPEAKILLPGYYDPYAPLGSDYAIYGLAIQGLNQVIGGIAANFEITYVDLRTPFLGKELNLTNIGSGDVHPTQAGYVVIAEQLGASAVPEPSSAFLIAAGLGIPLLVRLRRRVV